VENSAPLAATIIAVGTTVFLLLFPFLLFYFLIFLPFLFFLMRHHQHLLSCGTRCLRLEGLRVTKRSWVDYWFVASVFPINIIYQH